MTAISMENLERLEAEYGLEPGGLTYQHRCSRIAAYQKGEGDSWTPPAKQETRQQPTTRKFKDHPLFGKRILITPMMTPDAKRALAFDEVLGPEIEVRDFNAGERIYGEAKDVQRMVGDYEVVNVNHEKKVVALTTFPKIGTEISWKLGYELVPVVHGNDNKRGYIWSFPTSTVQIEDSVIQLYGLKTLIRQVYPELESQFKGKPMMDYVDGVTLVASIPQTHALLKKHREHELMVAKAGLSTDDNIGIY